MIGHLRARSWPYCHGGCRRDGLCTERPRRPTSMRRCREEGCGRRRYARRVLLRGSNAGQGDRHGRGDNGVCSWKATKRTAVANGTGPTREGRAAMRGGWNNSVVARLSLLICPLRVHGLVAASWHPTEFSRPVCDCPARSGLPALLRVEVRRVRGYTVRLWRAGSPTSPSRTCRSCSTGKQCSSDGALSALQRTCQAARTSPWATIYPQACTLSSLCPCMHPLRSLWSGGAGKRTR
jgi:hypothetical protein